MNDLANQAGTEGMRLPRIEIPESSWNTESLELTFSVATAAGEIIVTAMSTGHLECRGSTDALAAYGLFHQDWRPGIPGNNHSRQVVLFTVNGPQKAVGKFKRGPRNVQIDRLTVILQGVRIYVLLPFTPEQERRRHQHWEAWSARRAETLANERQREVPMSKRKEPDDARRHCCIMVDNAIDWLDKQLQETGCTYSRDSMNVIHRAYESLRRAFHDGRTVPVVPKYEVEGNLIHFPSARRTAERRA